MADASEGIAFEKATLAYQKALHRWLASIEDAFVAQPSLAEAIDVLEETNYFELKCDFEPGIELEGERELAVTILGGADYGTHGILDALFDLLRRRGLSVDESESRTIESAYRGHHRYQISFA